MSKIDTLGYTALWNRIQANKIDLSNLDNITYQEFNIQLNSKGKTDGLYKKAKALARNIPIQSNVNNYLKQKTIPTTIIKQLPEKELIPAYKREKVIQLPFNRFEKKSKKFKTVKGKKITIQSNVNNYKNDSKTLVKEALALAKRETQNFDGKQIKVDITANIIPNKKLDKDFREINTRSVQTLVRPDKDFLDYDMYDLDEFIDGFNSNYDAKGNIVVSVSIINFVEK